MHGSGREFAADGSLLREGKWIEGSFVDGASLDRLSEQKNPPDTPKASPAVNQEVQPKQITDTPPRIDFNTCVKLSYPEEARKKSAIGITSVSYLMNEDGDISSASIMMPSGDTPEHAYMDQLFLSAVKGCKGTAGTKQGVRQKLLGRIDYSWILPGAKIEANLCVPPATPENLQGGNSMGISEFMFAIGPEGGLSYAAITRPSGTTQEHAQVDHLAWRSIYSCPSVQSILLKDLPPGASGHLQFQWSAGSPKPQIVRRPLINVALCEKPEYTTAARRAEAQGDVVIVYTLSEKGVVEEASVEKSAGPTREHKQLDRAALESLKACKFGIPGTVDGVPTRLSGRITYNWRLTGSGFNFSSLLMLPLMLLRR
jgi:TonB family protein